MDNPRRQTDIQEFMHLCQSLLDYATQHGGLTDNECEGVALVVAYGRLLNKRTGPYEDLDALAASFAIATLSQSSD